MKSMKRLLAGILAGTLAIGGLTACGDSDSKNNSGKSNGNGEKVTIDIFQFKVEIVDELQAAIDLYMEQNDNVTINLETVGGGDDYGASLKTKMANADQPEIYNVGGPQDVLDWMDNLEDLSDQPWIEHTAEGLLDDVTVDGKIYGMPFGLEGYGFLYNKAIFEAADIDMEKIKTYDEIDAAFAKLKEKIDNGDLADEFPVLEAVVEYPTSETWVTGMHTANVALNQEFSSAMEAFNSEKIEFTYEKEFQKLIDLQVKYTSNADNAAALNAVDYSTQVGGGYAIERVAVIQQGNWVYPEIKTVDEEIANNTGLLPMPLAGVSEGNIPVGVPNNWAVNSESSDAEKQAAKDFLNWLYQSDEGKEIVVNKLGFISPFTNYDGMTPNDPIAAQISEYVNDGNITNWVWSGAPAGWAQDTLGVGIQAYVGGDKTWDEVIDTAKSDWESMR